MGEQEKEKQDKTERLLNRQITVVNTVIAGIGVMFIIAIFVLGYLQVKSSNELSDTMKTMKDDFKYNIGSFKEELDRTLPRYEQRVENLSRELNQKTEKEIASMKEEFNEIIGRNPKPAELILLYLDQSIQNQPLPGDCTKDKSNQVIRIAPPIVVLKNIGGKPTNQIMMYLYFHNCSMSNNYVSGYPSGYWADVYTSSDEYYSSKHNFVLDDESPKILNPGEVWNLDFPVFNLVDKNSPLKIKIEIFYGSENYLIKEIELTCKG